MDSNGTIMKINLPEDGSSYFSLTFAMSSAAQANISSWSQDDPAYKIQCVYFNETTYKWQSEGVKLVSYNSSTGLLNCISYHLTQFSA
jgi:hypothetical protein